MKNYKIAALAFIIVTLLFACRKDDYSLAPGEVTPIDTETEVFEEVDVFGVIMDEDLIPLEDVELSLGTQIATTDMNGAFRFEKVFISNEGSLIKIEKEGYFDGFKFTTGQAGVTSYISASLVRKNTQSFDGNSPANIQLPEGGSISFSSNTLVDKNNQVYQGQVNINAHWYDPSETGLYYTMPGDLRGISDLGEEVQLTTYGMIAVELESETGEELQLAEGSTARVNFPIPSGSNASDFNSIPTWHLDEATGVWIEEGSAIVENGFMVAELPHFSFWNCDVNYPLVNIKGRLISLDGYPFANQPVIITDLASNLTGSSTTNELGIFCGKVPQGVPLRLETSACSQNVIIDELGILDMDEDLGEISVDAFASIHIQAQLVDCMGDPLVEGYAIVVTSVGHKIIDMDADGRISTNILDCQDAMISIMGVDLIALTTSDPVSITLDQDSIDLNLIPVCNGNIGDLTCQVDLACCPTSGIVIFISNGISPFQVNIFDQAGDLVHDVEYIDPNITVQLDTDITYDVMIEDALGNKCEKNITVPTYLNGLIGNVWLDSDAGVMNEWDSEDTPYEGMEIRMLDASGAVFKTTFSTPNGIYTFENFETGTYSIQAILPAGFEFVQEGDPLEYRHSNVDQATGLSETKDIDGWDFDIEHRINVGIREL